MGIYDAFDTVEAPVKAAAAPPIHGFGGDTLSAGWQAGQAGTDWGWHQANYENEIRGQLEDELRKRGRDAPHYDVVGAQTGRRLKAAGAQIDPMTQKRMEDADRFWASVAEEKKRDPKFAKQFEGLDDVDSVAKVALARRQKDEDEAGGVYDKSTGMGKAAWWVGNFATGFVDPLSYIPIGSGVTQGGTIASRILGTAAREAAINAGAQIALEPLIQADAKKRGQKRGVGDAALDVTFAAGIGGLLGAGEAGFREVFTNPKTGRAAVDATVDAIGRDNLTPDEKAAVNVLTRELDIKESNPFVASPEGDKAHGSRLATAMASLEADRPVPDFKSRMRSGTSLGTEGDSIAQFKAMVRTAESGGNDAAKNPLSSATGRYQFTDATWLQYYKRTFPVSGLDNEQILAKRADGAVQERLMDALTQDNSRLLAAAGQDTTPGNLYLVHFLGTRATKLLKAADDVPVESLLPAEFIRANPSVLEGKTAGEVIAWADKKMGGEGIVVRGGEDVATLNPDLFDDPEAYRLAQADDGPEESPFSFSEGGDQRSVGQAREQSGMDWSELPEPSQLNIPRVPSKSELEQFSRIEDVSLSASRRGNQYDWANNASANYGEPLVEGFADKPLAVKLETGEYVVLDGNHRAALEARRGAGSMEMRVIDARSYDPANMGRKPAKNSVSDDDLLADLGIFDNGTDLAPPLNEAPGGQTSRRAPLTPDGRSTGAERVSNMAPEARPRNEMPDVGDGIPERVVQETEASQHFTQPMDADAKAQTDSIIHDLTAEVLEGEDMGSYRLADEGAETTLDEVLASVQADEAAIAAARNCL